MMRSKAYTAVSLLLLVAAGLAFSSARRASTTVVGQAEVGPSELPSQVQEISGYRNWTKVNPERVYIPSALNTLCRVPTNADRAAEGNPHISRMITVYVNDLGRQAMMEERHPKFPVGAVIVKEKVAAGRPDAPELLTVMIKREAGFNPDMGDWEFMAASGDGTKIEARGRLQNCQACHASMKETDFIYRSYMPAESQRALR